MDSTGPLTDTDKVKPWRQNVEARNAAKARDGMAQDCKPLKHPK